ncbi:MAG: hypothetical protein QM756_06400 [Polyangiaceae bacterium]
MPLLPPSPAPVPLFGGLQFAPLQQVPPLQLRPLAQAPVESQGQPCAPKTQNPVGPPLPFVLPPFAAMVPPPKLPLALPPLELALPLPSVGDPVLFPQ